MCCRPPRPRAWTAAGSRSDRGAQGHRPPGASECPSCSSWSTEDPREGVRENTPRGGRDPQGWGVPIRQGEGEDAWSYTSDPGTRTRPWGEGGGRGGGGEGTGEWGRSVLTRPQAPTCQAWSLSRGQWSRTQGSVSGGRSSKEHAVAWSRDPSSPRQVTLRLRTPAPQLTEHCEDLAVSASWSSPSWEPISLAWRADSTPWPQAQRG